jgi:hypothetical protein
MTTGVEQEATRINLVIPNLFRDNKPSPHVMLKQVQHDDGSGTRSNENKSRHPELVSG